MASGLEIIDIVVIISYFIVVILIGFWSMKRIKNQEDYFLAGRRFGKFIQCFASFGQATSPDTAVGVTATTYSNGAAGIWSSLIYLFATPFYWMVAPWMRRLRLLTLGDFFEERYGSKKMASMYAIIGTLGLMAIIAVGFTAMTKTVMALSPKPMEQLTIEQKIEYKNAVEWDNLRKNDYINLTPAQQQRLNELNKFQPRKVFSSINKNIFIWLVCFIVIIYAVLGGLEAAFLTDMIQGVFIILLSIALIPFAMYKMSVVYGCNGLLDIFKVLHEQLPESSFEIFGSPAAIDFTWYYIAALALMGSINVVVQPNSLVVGSSGKDEYTCRFGFVVGNFMKRFASVAWGFFALLAIALYHNEVYNPDLVFGHAVMDLLGPLKIGLVGLMIACLMAALMSTADCLMITCSSLLTRNLYKYIIKNKSESHYILVGRIIGAIVVIGGAYIATSFDSILQILKFMWEINVMVAAAFWLGMKWRKANRQAAWASIIITSLFFYIAPCITPLVFPSLKTNSYLLKTTTPKPIKRTYIAKKLDIQKRTDLTIGQKFEKTFQHPAKSIFWSKGIKHKQGLETGTGMINLELLLLDKLGFNLENNPYSLNETIRIGIRTITPFMILFIIGSSTKQDNKESLDRFFVKMKTPVIVDRQKDEAELNISYQNPQRFVDKKIFPNSNWEFDKWTKTDFTGFIISCFGILSVILFLVILISIGK